MARAAIGEAEAVFVSSISFFEIAQMTRIGKWPQMEPFRDRLPEMPASQGGSIAILSPGIALRAGTAPRKHRGPFGRFLAATAIHYALPLISADTIFDGVIGRVW